REELAAPLVPAYVFRMDAFNRAEQPSKFIHSGFDEAQLSTGPAPLRADCLHKAHYLTPQGGALNPLKRRNQPKSLGTGDKFCDLGLEIRLMGLSWHVRLEARALTRRGKPRNEVAHAPAWRVWRSMKREAEED